MKHFRKLLLAIAAFLPASSMLLAQSKLSDPVPIAPEVKIGKLANGLTYYIKRNLRPEKKVELRLVVKTGSMLEDDDQQGLAHFTEHMSFNGSTHFKKNELVDFLQSIGVKFGADLNAYTGFEETVYILPIPLDKPANLDKGLEVLEDWAGGVSFESSEIDKERGVVLEESRLGKGAQDRMNKTVYPKLFEGSSYANRLPIGKDEILKSFKYDAIKRFYHDWYRPDLMAVVAVGDIDPVTAEDLIKKHFEHLKNPSGERPRFTAQAQPRTKTEAIVVSDKESPRSLLNIYYAPTKAKGEVTIEDFRTYIVKNLAFGMLGGRFAELSQKPDAPFIFGTAQLGNFVRGYQAVSAVALIGPNGPEPAVRGLIQETERVRKYGFTAAELDRAKLNTLKSMESYYNERDKTESNVAIGELVRNFTEHEMISGPVKEYGFYQEFLPGISLDEVNKTIAGILSARGEKLIVLMTPEKTDYALPTPAQLVDMVTAAEKMDVSAYEEKAVATSLTTANPAPGKIVSEKENKELGFFDLTLSNGIRVIVKPTDFKNDEVNMTASRYGGTSLYGNADQYSADFATQVVSQMGTGDFTPVDLGKVLAGKNAGAFVWMSTNSEGVSGQSGVADIETMLQLTWLSLMQPRKDDALFNSFVSKQKANAQNRFADPQTVFRDTVLKVLYNNHPRAPRVPRGSSYDKINEDRALAIYKERFADLGGMPFIFTGKIDMTTFRPLIAKWLGSLPGTPHTSAFKDLGIRPIKGEHKLNVNQGQADKSLIQLTWTGEAEWSEGEQFKLQALMETMNIKLIEKLREELSGIYGGSISGSLSRVPYGSYQISVTLPCGPENVDKLVAATLAEIEVVKKSGPQEVDLNKVKENWKKQYDENLRSNGWWLRQLQSFVDGGTSSANILNYKARVDALTVAQLQATAAKYLGGKNYFQAILYPAK